MSESLNSRIQNLSPAQRALLERRLLERKATTSPTNAVTRREVLSPAPLSYSQELLWLLSQFADKGVAYNTPAAFRLRGPIDAEILERALRALADRHEILRTRYDLVDERPMQIIEASARLSLTVIDLSRKEPHEREAELQRILQAESEHPFDLKTDSVMRSTLVKVADEDHVFLNVLHHVATDGYSRAIIYRDLSVLYDSIAEGRPSPLEDLPIQYADYAVWHRRWLDSGVLDEQLEYWKERLAGAPSRLELSTDFPRPAVRSSQGDHRSLMVDPVLREALRDLGREQGGTLFIALLGAFATLLHRYTGQDDIVVGTPFAGRNRTEFESMVGYFINPLALRVDLSGDPSFRELLTRARETTIEAFKYADVPYEMVVNATNPQRDLSQTPVFQAMMVLHNPAWQTDRPKFQPRGVAATEVVYQKEWAKFDVLLGMSERQAGLNTTWEYSTELFEHATIERMMRHFRQLIASAVADPDRALSRLSLLDEDERSTILGRWAADASFPVDERPVKELYEEQASRTPHAEAVVLGAERLSYDELNRRANRLAHRLRTLGVGPNQLVGIFMEKSVDLVVSVLAVMKAGGAYVPIDPLYPVDRIEFMLQDASPTVVLSEPHLREALPSSSATVFAVDWDDLALESEGDPLTSAGPDDLAYVIYTSGSTGLPKGALILNRSLSNAYAAYEQAYGLRDVSSHLQMASFSFDVFTGDFIRALLSGGKLVLCPLTVLMDPERLYDLMMEEAIDCAEFVPAVATLLFDYAAATGKDLSFMRVVVVSSEAWRGERYRFFKSLCGPDTRLINSYGLTEATIDSTYFEPEETDAVVPDRFVPIGRPLANTQVYILDSNLQPVPLGLPGELCIGGVGVARGYLNRPELTGKRFVPDPFTAEAGALLYRTGDLVRWLPDGNVDFIGRTDRQVKIRGFRIEPGEVEAAIERHQTVESAAVVVREDRPGDARLVAYVIASPGASFDTGELRQSIAESLPAYMVPAALVQVDEFPLTPNGKIDRDALPEPPAHQAATGDEFVQARTESERLLADIWCDVLGLESVGVNENFFELGGHSLLATRVLARLRQTLGVDLTLRSIFEFPTLVELARVVDESTAQPDASLPALAPVDRSRLRVVGARTGP